MAFPRLNTLSFWLLPFAAVLLVAFLLWRRRQEADFQYYAFLIALGYLVSYLGYVLLPARGPRFLLKDLDNLPLHGLWLFQGMQSTLDKSG